MTERKEILEDKQSLTDYGVRLVAWWASAVLTFAVATVIGAAAIWTGSLPEHDNTFTGYLIDLGQTVAALMLGCLSAFIYLCAAGLFCISFEEAAE